MNAATSEKSWASAVYWVQLASVWFTIAVSFFATTPYLPFLGVTVLAVSSFIAMELEDAPFQRIVFILSFAMFLLFGIATLMVLS